MTTDDRADTSALIPERETVDAPAVATTPPALPLPRRPSPVGRVWQWFWRGDAMRASQQPLDPERAELHRRARLAMEVARRAGESAEPFEGSVEPVLGDLYRQAIYWSLQALARRQPSSEPFAVSSPSRWEGIDNRLLSKAAGDEPTLERIKQATDSLTFTDFAVLPPVERASLVSSLRAVAAALVSELELGKRLVQALWLQRFLRVGLLIVGLVLLFGGAITLRDRAEARADLAAGKAWRTSSFYNGCRSPEQECSGTPDYFFHTQQEASPWLEIDLGSTETVSAVRVDNRKDCCTERASPLVIDVSTDQKQWRQVARREGAFGNWRADFSSVKARWVRIRVDTKEGILHLQRVRILR